MFQRAHVTALAVLSLLAAALTAQDIPQTLDPAQGCTTKCHQDRTKGTFLHGPLKEGECSECHIQADDTRHTFAKIDNVRGLCGLCHEMEMAANVHAPVNDGQCINCHDPHMSEVKSLLKAPTEKALCGQCHAEAIANSKKEFVHGPVAAAKCTLCHNPHSAPEAKLLDAEPVEYCLQCHESQATAIDEAENVHGPVMASCAACHDPHGGDHPFMMKNDTRAMCLGCHEELAKSMQEPAVAHGVVNTEQSCLACHQPHVSRFPKMLDQAVKENCLQCHQGELQREEKKPIGAVGNHLDQSKFLHGPIREGDCTGCHQPHAAATSDLLVLAYPELFYTPYKTENYAICFNCHDKKVFETAKTESLTSFRDGDVNLHFVHVSREKKGRTCRACHEIHGSNLPHHMAESVPFGKWAMPIKYEKLPTGGSCAPGCHKALPYDHDKPIGDGQGGK